MRDIRGFNHFRQERRRGGSVLAQLARYPAIPRVPEVAIVGVVRVDL